MEVLHIEVNGKTYTTERITTGLSREAMRTNAETFAYARFCHVQPEELSREDYVEQCTRKGLALSDRKLNLICRVYGNQFGIEELENSLTNAEVAYQINAIIRGVGEIASKN